MQWESVAVYDKMIPPMTCKGLISQEPMDFMGEL